MCRSLVRFWDLKTALRDAVYDDVGDYYDYDYWGSELSIPEELADFYQNIRRTMIVSTLSLICTFSLRSS